MNFATSSVTDSSVGTWVGAPSETVPVPGWLIKPDASVAMAERAAPSARVDKAVIDQAPLASAVAVPIKVPPLLTCTSTPGSAVPTTALPSLGNNSGASGACVSTLRLNKLDADCTCPPDMTRAVNAWAPSASAAPGVASGVKLQAWPVTVALPKNAAPS